MKRATSTRPPTAHIAPFGLRLQEELRAKLEAAATESGRSLNAEITERLVASFEPKGPESWSEDFVSKALVTALERIDSLEKNLLDMIESGNTEAVKRILDTHRAAYEKRLDQAETKSTKKSIEFTVGTPSKPPVKRRARPL